MIKKREKNNAAIYCRLSVDDGLDQQSQSIENQKEILTKYCLDHGFNIFNIYIDDGFSGTSFDRPGLIKLKNDIESGFIDIVVTKDLSRLGRDHIEMGIFLERYFPDNSIRYIAVNDNVDTINELDDYIPIKSIVNELYAKDISKKIRATQKHQRETGQFRRSAYSLYGYQFNEDATKRYPNPDTAPIVLKIFEMASKGYSIMGIVDYLSDNKILTPRSYHLKINGIEFDESPYKWTYSTIINILKNKEYLGYYIKGKSSKRFKSKKKILVPEEEQYVFKNVFEPIVSKELFDLAQKMLNGSRNNTGLINPYKGLVYCGICLKPLRFIRHKSSKGYYEERLYCTNKNETGKASIMLKDLNEVIKRELTALKNVILANEEKFIELAKERIATCKVNSLSNEYSVKLSNIETRIDKIKEYSSKLLSQTSNNLLPKDSYQKIMKEYNEELELLNNEKKKYELFIESNNDKSDIEAEINSFLTSINSIEDNNILSPFIIRNIISKIIITTFKQDKKSELGKEIIIYYRACDDLIKDFINEGKK